MASIQTNGTVQHVTKDSLKHAPATASILNNANKPVCHVTRLFIPVAASEPIKIVNGFLHLPQDYNAGRAEHSSTTAAILLSGAGGGVVGPSSIYLSIADKLASLSRGIPILRLDYRYPARNKHCVSDVVAAMNFLQKDYAVDRFLLVGWSFGGAPVFSVGGKDDRVTGCATIASQTSETEGIVQIARKNVPVLLMHGTADRILSPSCSESLYARYRQYSSSDKCEIKLFDGDDHSLTKNSLGAEGLLCNFIIKQGGGMVSEDEKKTLIGKALVGEDEKIQNMEEGGDLRGESVR